MGETAGNNTTLANYATSISCVKRGTTTVVASGPGAGPLDVPVMPNDDIVCTITNSGAYIEITKVALDRTTGDPYCPGRYFGFSLSPSTTFSLYSNVCSSSFVSTVKYPVTPDTDYTIEETDSDINVCGRLVVDLGRLHRRQAGWSDSGDSECLDQCNRSGGSGRYRQVHLHEHAGQPAGSDPEQEVPTPRWPAGP